MRPENEENWRKRIGENWSGLKWIGRRKNGVSEWRGTWRNGPPLWFCRLFSFLGVGLLAMGILGGIIGLLIHSPVTPMFSVFLFVGIIHSIVGWICYKQHSIFSQLRETDEMTEQMGLTSEEISRLAEERDIKPKIYFNGVPLYHPDELIQARSLLRASEQPVNNETLLRAASPAPSATETEQLLRASTNA